MRTIQAHNNEKLKIEYFLKKEYFAVCCLNEKIIKLYSWTDDRFI